MSQTTASVIVVLVLFGLAVFLGIAPPEGFQDLPYRVVLPFTLIVVGFVQLENIRMRTHMAELIGALKAAVGQSQQRRNVPVTPKAKGEAIKILLQSITSGDATARATTARQLTALTGQDFGEDAEAWKNWWFQNKGKFEADA